jgi:hypothetical protein
VRGRGVRRSLFVFLVVLVAGMLAIAIAIGALGR